MLPSQSPFPCQWWGTSLDIVGLGDMRPDVGTYGRFDFEQLPRLPFELRGDFAWLLTASSHEQHIGLEKAKENGRAIPALQGRAAKLGKTLPESFVQFLTTPDLFGRVRSNTDCLLDVCSQLIPLPTVGGYLIRFLSDSQGCVFWYLYLTTDAADHAVVSTPAFYGTEAEQWQDETPEGSEIVFSSGSFEEFVGRFWLENEIWFSAYEKKPISEVGRAYIDSYRRGGGSAA